MQAAVAVAVAMGVMVVVVQAQDLGITVLNDNNLSRVRYHQPTKTTWEEGNIRLSCSSNNTNYNNSSNSNNSNFCRFSNCNFSNSLDKLNKRDLLVDMGIDVR